MIQDLTNYDFVELCLATNWPEEEQARLVLNFSELLSKYLEQQLAGDFTPEINQQFEELLKDPSITPDKLLEFYKTHMPNLEQKIDSLALDLKKRFLLKFYAQEAQNNPSWNEVLHAADQDDWNTAWEKLQVVKTTLPAHSPSIQSN